MIAELKSVFSLPICPVTEKTIWQAVYISLWTRLARRQRGGNQGCPHYEIALDSRSD
jgi:hypothetical protein